MFASATFSSVSKAQAGAYRHAYAATGVGSASAHGLIGMLYDGALAAIAEARGAMRTRNVPARIKAIGRALRIVDEGLGEALDMDAGGAIARDLHALYTYISLRLAHANLRNDEAALDECVRLIEPLRSAWAAIADRVAA